MKFTFRFMVRAVVLCLVALFSAGLSWGQNYSHARIVRLSFVEGTVTVQRPDMPEWAMAPVNTPIQEGFKLSTAENSFAEVEFENTSTVRVGQLSLLEFDQLALTPSGGKVNRLALDQGYATFNVIPEGNDVYEIKAADATLTPSGKTEFRTDLDQEQLRVEVFKGSVAVSSPHGSETLSKNMVLLMNPGAEQPYEISQGITKDAWDEWVAQRDNQMGTGGYDRHGGVYSSFAGSPYYGWNDLEGYGSWSHFPGYGYGWCPYVSNGWAPYSLGRWGWYPTFGNTWISFEPWGWLPYHFGNWFFEPDFGWFWLPGSFGAWSPALVNWYQGPGWIGWAPQSVGLVGTGQNNCHGAKGCVTTVGVNTFQNGKPVTPESIVGVDLSQGRRVAKPDIPPGRLAMLPGPALPRAAAFLDSRSTGQIGVSSGVRQVSSGTRNGILGRAPTAVRAPSNTSAGNAWPTGSGAAGRTAPSVTSSRSGGGSISRTAPSSSAGSSGLGRSGGSIGGGSIGGGGGTGGGSHGGGSRH